VEGKSLFTLLGEYSPEMIEEIFTGKKARGGYAFRDPVPAGLLLMCPGCPHRGIFQCCTK
jgi:indolepyruvate ferredoxin oxidoreductase alpha subunit